MNYSAILAPTAYIQHEEGCPHALTKVLHKQIKDLLITYFTAYTSICPWLKSHLESAQCLRLFNLEKRGLGETLSPSAST